MNFHCDLAFVVLGVCGIVVATFKYNLRHWVYWYKVMLQNLSLPYIVSIMKYSLRMIQST